MCVCGCGDGCGAVCVVANVSTRDSGEGGCLLGGGGGGGDALVNRVVVKVLWS